MLRWILSFFRKRLPDSDHSWVMGAADRLTDTVMDALSAQFEIAKSLPSEILQHKEFFVASYVAGFCDVIAQGAGARAGGTLSMTLSGRVMQRLFGNTHGNYMWNKVDEGMAARN